MPAASTQLNLAKLAQIDRSKLTETDQLAYDVFWHNQESALRGMMTKFAR